MLQKNINKVREIIMEVFTGQSEELNNAIINALMGNKEILKALGKEIDKAQAARISSEISRKVEELRDEEREMEQSTTPWFKMVTVGYDPDKGDELEFGYNSAWIKHLKDRGITGKSPEEIINNWIALLNMETILDQQDW